MTKNKLTTLVPYALLVLLTLLFCISLFKNISYPLLWNDEGDTAMYATRIMEYGYPKVHDGKNVLYLYPVDMKLGTQEKYDLYTASPILGYYWAVPGVFLAKFVDDLYTKTMLLRIPFAVTGLIGLFIFALLPFKIYQKKPMRRLWFVVFFVFLELLSVSLVLQLRDMRRYSMLILFTGGVLYLYARHRILKEEKPGFGLYVGATAALLFLIFSSYYPLFFILLATLGLHECLGLLNGVFTSRKVGSMQPLCTAETLKPFLPLIIAVVSILPLLFLFRTFQVASVMASLDVGTFSLGMYFGMFFDVLKFLTYFEFLPLALFMKTIRVAAVFRNNRKNSKVSEEVSTQIRVSNFLTLFFIVHLIVIARMPVVWSRYFLVLQPALTLILLLDAFVSFELLGQSGIFARPKRLSGALILLAATTIFLINFTPKIEDIKGHLYELTHRYKGPLDFVIPYIKANFPNTENLTIATNYEEHCYMYYLGSKVIIGCRENNLKEDLKAKPDIIIFRSSWTEMEKYLGQLWKKSRYKTIAFPVEDKAVNNIPELYFLNKHLFRTPVAKPLSRRLLMYVKWNYGKTLTQQLVQ